MLDPEQTSILLKHVATLWHCHKKSEMCLKRKMTKEAWLKSTKTSWEVSQKEREKRYRAQTKRNITVTTSTYDRLEVNKPLFSSAPEGVWPVDTPNKETSPRKSTKAARKQEQTRTKYESDGETKPSSKLRRRTLRKKKAATVKRKTKTKSTVIERNGETKHTDGERKTTRKVRKKAKS